LTIRPRRSARIYGGANRAKRMGATTTVSKLVARFVIADVFDGPDPK
jgi:hypothetical protein